MSENNSWIEAAWDAGIYARLFSELLGVPIAVALASNSDCISEAELSVKEKEQYEFLSNRRKRSFLLGRTALKQLLAESGGTGETGHLSFPVAGYSLSHSSGRGVAVSCLSPVSKIRVGVDIEMVRRLDRRSAKFFLSESEKRWLAKCDDSRVTLELIRLWTVKEALFKANMSCADRSLVKYGLFSPASSSGEAGHELSGGRFRYATLASDGFYISCAVLEEE